jgi:ribosomal protein S18 acetylase RimI-like enzyme
MNQMLNINIVDDNLRIKNIDNESMKSIYPIFINTGDFKYATGISNFISFDLFSRQIIQFLSEEDAFFLNIYSSPKNEHIGLVKGKLIRDENILWLNLLAIVTHCQSKGYGSRVIFLLENHFRERYGIEKMCLSASKDNFTGINFWKRCGFIECNFIPKKDFAKLADHVQIMWKML